MTEVQQGPRLCIREVSVKRELTVFPTAKIPFLESRVVIVELFALDSGPLRSNELSIHSLNYKKKMQTSSKVTFTL